MIVDGMRSLSFLVRGAVDIWADPSRKYVFAPPPLLGLWPATIAFFLVNRRPRRTPLHHRTWTTFGQ